jgi:hypothetical protein
MKQFFLFTLSVCLIGIFEAKSTVDACISVPPPYVISGKTVYICKGDWLNITGYNCLGNTTPPQESYSWVNLSNPGTPLTNKIISVQDTGRWELTLTNLSTFASDKDTLHVRFYFQPTFEINNGQVLVQKCKNITVTLTATNNVNFSNYQWYIAGNATVLGTGTTYDVGVVPGGSQFYAATAYYSATGCTVSDTIYVNTFPTPEPDLGKDTNLCVGQSLILMPNGLTTHRKNYQFMWWDQGAFVNNDSMRTVTTSGTYYVTMRGPTPFTCTGSDTIVVTFNPYPDVTARPDTLICYGDGAPMSVSITNAPGPYIYSWSPSTGLSNPAIANPTASPTSTTTYTVTVTAKGCADNSSTTITVNPQIILTHPFTDSTICLANTDLTLGVNASGGDPSYTYSWTPLANVISGANTNAPVVRPPSAMTFNVLVTDQQNCSRSSNVNINIQPNVSPFISVNTSFSDSTICNSMQLLATASGGVGPYAYSWTPLTDIIGANSSNPTVNPSAPATYTVTATDKRNCRDSKSVNIDILWINILSQDTIGFVGDSIKIGVYNSSQSGFQYRWKDGAGNILGSDSLIMIKSTGKYIVEVYHPVTNCFVTDSINAIFIAELMPSVYVPSVFNPDMTEADNAHVRVYGVKIDNESFLFRIYNQWGDLVYETSDFTEANQTGWNGKMKNSGSVLNTGVYTYTLSGQFLDGTTFERTGTVSMVR